MHGGSVFFCGRKRGLSYLPEKEVMIYAQSITTQQEALVPYSGLGIEDNALFSVSDTVSGEQVCTAEITLVEQGYWHIEFTLPAGIPDGEYEYRITQDGQCIGSGVMQIGAIRRKAKEAATGGINIKQSL